MGIKHNVFLLFNWVIIFLFGILLLFLLNIIYIRN